MSCIELGPRIHVVTCTEGPGFSALAVIENSRLSRDAPYRKYLRVPEASGIGLKLKPVLLKAVGQKEQSIAQWPTGVISFGPI
jgi:hypothetical protein